MILSDLTTTLELSESDMARLWQAHVIRSTLSALGVYVPPAIIAREERAEMEAALHAAAARLPLADLHALMALAEHLEAPGMS